MAKLETRQSKYLKPIERAIVWKEAIDLIAKARTFPIDYRKWLIKHLVHDLYFDVYDKSKQEEIIND